jgi:hypothetical protein
MAANKAVSAVVEGRVDANERRTRCPNGAAQLGANSVLCDSIVAGIHLPGRFVTVETIQILGAASI